MKYSFPKCLLLLFSHSVMSDFLWPHGLQPARSPCPSPSLRVCSNSSPLSWWHHPTISSCVVPFSSCPQSFPASEFFPVSQLFTSTGQVIVASAATGVLSTNVQNWFSLGLTGLISLQSKGLSRVFSTPQFESINSLALSILYGSTLTSVHGPLSAKWCFCSLTRCLDLSQLFFQEASVF